MRALRTAGVLLLVALIPSTSAAPPQPITALAPVEIWADGFLDLRGLAISADGAVHVADREAGTVTRIAPDRSRTIVASGLERPIGLAFDLTERLLIAEERAARVVRLEANGTRTPIVSGIKQPRWLAVHEDGTLFISARRLTRDADPEPDDESAEPEAILRLTPAGQLLVFADGFRHLQGLAVADAAVFAATKGRRDESRVEGVVYQIAILANGAAGAIAQLGPGDAFKKPVGIARDALGALVLTTRELDLLEDRSKRAIATLHPDGRVSGFASNLEKPQGLGFDAAGNLYLADGNSGRVVRFLAPPAPTFTALPEVTNQSPLTVSGTATPNARLSIFVNDAATALTTSANTAGAFSLAVALTPNTENTLEAWATTHSGDGLTSPATTATLTHDGIAPQLTVIQPLPSAFVRQTTTVEVRATDGESGVASVALQAGSQALTPALSPPPPAPAVTATALWTTTTAADGAQTLTTQATDRAGNLQTLTRVVLVDNTAPDTTITGGPTGEIGDTTAAFSFTGTDNLTATANLVFAWRLDGGAWAAFTASTSATLTGLSEGAHTFEVKARDLAGNEDPTPAARAFTVILRPTITSVSPSNGVIGTRVTITGSGFVPGATAVAFNDTAGVVGTATTTQLTLIVPPAATTGPLTVTTARGVASAPFTVTATQDIALQAVPATLTLLQGTTRAATLTLPSLGSVPFTGLAALEVTGLPGGVTVALSAPALTGGQMGTLTLTASPTAVVGSATVIVTATAPTETGTLTRTVSLPLTVEAGGRAALLGQITFVNGTPIAGVRLTLDTVTTTSDAGGNFLLLDPPAGTQTLSLDANVAQAGLPIYAVDVTLVNGHATALTPFRITPPPPPGAFVPIANASADQVVTDARYPGLSVTLPAGVTITGWDSTLKNKIALERLSPDALPVPPPPGETRALYQIFFGTPMGGVPSAPLPVTVPNDQGLLPGEKAEIWYYDAAPFPGVPAGWRQAGLGTVSDDGTRIVADPGVGIARFCGVCGVFCILKNTLGQVSRKLGSLLLGDPVDIALGQLIVEKTDLVLPGRLPATVQRTYSPFDPFGRVAGFELQTGPGWTLSLDIVLLEEGPALRHLILPGNARIALSRQPNGTFITLDDATFAGAVLTALSTGVHELRFKDGATWRFASGWFPRGRPVRIVGLGLLVEQRDRNGNVLAITRDLNGGITQVTEPGGRVLTFTTERQPPLFEPMSARLTKVRDPLGREVRYTYSASETGRRLETVVDPAGGVTRYTYGTSGATTGRILTITDPRGITYLTNEYDAQGRVSRQTQADGGVWSYAYEGPAGAHTRVAVTNPRGHTTTYRHNSQGLPIEVADALGQTTRTERDAAGRPIATTDPLGRVARFTYDAAGNVTQVTEAAGQVRRFTYEPIRNRVASLTDPLGNITRFEYDGAGNLLAIIDPRGQRTTLAYNGVGQPTSVTDPLTNTTRFEYDTVGNLTAVVDPLGNRTLREYDAVSRLVTQLDALGRPTRFAYDMLNRLQQSLDALAGVTGFDYDPNGNLFSVTDARGGRTGYTFDAMDRVTTRSDPLLRSESYTYDGNGNVATVTDRKGQVTTSTYDALDRRTQVVYQDGSKIRFVYDGAGRLTQLLDSLGGVIVRTYDALDRLTQETSAQGSVSYAYDGAGRRTTMTVTGQPPVSYAYDPANRLTAITQGSAIVALTYDDANRRTSLALPNGVVTEYAYDAASRLTGLTYRRAGAVLGTLTYAYDADGQRRAIGGTWARTSLPSSVVAATYNAANQQVAFAGQTLTYDLNGNLTSDGANTYTWDPRNRLAAITGPTPASFVYDAAGRRQRKTVNGTTTDFVHDGLNPVQELAVAGTASLLTGLGIDEYFARTDTSGTQSLVSDALGSTVALTDEGGAVQAEYTYEPFGRTAFSGTPTMNSLDFTGRESDGTGLKYYRARYYHPGFQRFISEDPIEFVGGDINLYGYVRNNPIGFRDPGGLLVGQLVARASSFVFRAGLTAEEIAINGQFLDATVGAVAAVAGPFLPKDVLEASIPGSEIFTIGDVLAVVSGYGGVQTLSLSGTIAGLYGAGAAVGTASAGAIVVPGLLALAGGLAVGDAVNYLLLNNRRIFRNGNPLENFLYDLLYAPPRPKGAFARGR